MIRISIFATSFRRVAFADQDESRTTLSIHPSFGPSHKVVLQRNTTRKIDPSFISGQPSFFLLSECGVGLLLATVFCHPFLMIHLHQTRPTAMLAFEFSTPRKSRNQHNHGNGNIKMEPPISTVVLMICTFGSSFLLLSEIQEMCRPEKLR